MRWYKRDKIDSFLQHYKYSIILLKGLEKYDSLNQIHKNMDVSYSTLCKTLKYLVKKKLINKVKVGRTNKLNLTPKGTKALNLINRFKNLIGENIK